jgi:RND family efflux transporter MFP subunit
MIRISSVLFRVAVTLGMVALAVIVGISLWNYYLEAPWTRDGRVRADVVAIAPDVSGLVTEVLVKDNQDVKRGDVLFRVDPDRYEIALRQAEATLAGMKAVAEQKAADYYRYSHLTSAAVSQQKVEEARAADLQAKADVQRAIADRDLAKLNLERSSVKARVNGRVTNVSLRPGTYVAVGKGVFALIDSDTLRVEGYFEETKLHHIQVGDTATVHLMGDGRYLRGHVESIAGGIEDRERTEGSNLLANVNPTFSWVRLAQRIPVRIKLDSPPSDMPLVVGRTATVSIDSGTATASGTKN